MKFNHISNSPFPHVPEELPINDFDYDRWAEYESAITLCNAPWGTSEVQVGMRSIGGLGKVVKFETDEKRDKWFDDLSNKVTFTTPYRGFSQETFQLKIPFDMALNYNYLYVEYNPATSNDALIDYEGVNGVKRIYYFIRDIKYHAPNNTEFICLLDHWTTFINSVEFISLGVERGHVATAQTTVDKYLNNPLANNEYLLHEDITGANGGFVVGKTTPLVFNAGQQFAIIASTADINATLSVGRDSVRCNYIDATETPGLHMCAVDVAELGAFMRYANTTAPQLIATIRGVYIVDGDLFRRYNVISYDGFTLYYIRGYVSRNTTYTFSKSDFAFSNGKYGKLAKLYTYPYSYLEVTNWRGDSSIIKIEDCAGALTIEKMANITAPFMSIQAAILGVGGGTRTEITFNAIEELKYYSQGREYAFTWEWPIPCYGVTQQPSIDYDIHTVHDRAQRAEENTTAQTNALASNATANSNALASNATANINALAVNETNKNNADAAILNTRQTSGYELTLHETLTTLNNGVITDETAANWQKSQTDWSYDKQLNWWSTQFSNDAIAATTISNLIGNAATHIAGGAAIGGPGGVAAGAVSGLVSGVTSGYNNAVTISNNETLASLSIEIGDLKQIYSEAPHKDAIEAVRTGYNTDVTRETNITNARIVRETQDMLAANAGRDKTTADANANRNKATADANANRTKATADANTNRSKVTADNAITRAIAQAGLSEPRLFGAYANGEETAIKPMGLEFNIVSQNSADIALAGEAFLRYGYYINRWFDFDTFNYGSKFTYWKCFDMNTGAIKLPDAFVDRIKNLLLGGITVYSKPEYIETATLYNNGF